MKVPNEVYAAVLNAFVAPLDAKVSRPWFNQQTGTAYASNRRELVRVGGLNAAPKEQTDSARRAQNLISAEVQGRENVVCP